MSSRLGPGEPAPAFALSDPDGRTVSLRDYAGQRVVVYFYPAALTPGCTTQAIDFSASITQFRERGVEVVGISPDAPAKLQQFREKKDIAICLLSDPERDVLRAYGAYGPKKLYGKIFDGVIRSTFVVAVDEAGAGTVQIAQYNIKATGHVARLRKELGLDPEQAAG